MLQYVIIQFPLYYMSSGANGRLKTNDNFKLLALEVVAVSYERWCGRLQEVPTILF